MVAQSNESNTSTDPTLKLESSEVNSSPDPESESASNAASEALATYLTEIKERGIGPTNYLHVYKPDAAIEGKYALDLSMAPILQHSLDGVLISKQNLNLVLETLKGHIHADVWVIPDASGKSKRASMTLLSHCGSIRTKVHHPPVKSGAARANFDIEIIANLGDVSVWLPRCFRGEITIRAKHDSIAFSPKLGAYAAPLLEIPQERVYFVRDELCGDQPSPPPRRGGGRHRDRDRDRAEEADKKDRCPDEPFDALLIHGKHTSVRISWDDEKELSDMKPLEIVTTRGGWKALLNGAGKRISDTVAVGRTLLPPSHP